MKKEKNSEAESELNVLIETVFGGLKIEKLEKHGSRKQVPVARSHGLSELLNEFA